MLLQILDDGRLTDGKGRTVDFKNTVIIMTSNMGSDLIFNTLADDLDEIRPQLMDILRQYLRPEFINRLDDIILFHRLSQSQIEQIVEIQLAKLRKRLAERHVLLDVTEEAMHRLAQEGFDPQHGARPLKRVIQREIENNLAKEMLSGNILPNHNVRVDYRNDRFVFEA